MSNPTVTPTITRYQARLAARTRRNAIRRGTLPASAQAVVAKAARIAGQHAKTARVFAGDDASCKHPSTRLFSYFAGDVHCVGCCECGDVLAGGAQ